MQVIRDIFFLLAFTYLDISHAQKDFLALDLIQQSDTFAIELNVPCDSIIDILLLCCYHDPSQRRRASVQSVHCVGVPAGLASSSCSQLPAPSS